MLQVSRSYIGRVPMCGSLLSALLTVLKFLTAVDQFYMTCSVLSTINYCRLVCVQSNVTKYLRLANTITAFFSCTRSQLATSPCNCKQNERQC